jgi:hypothetical protein
MINHVIVNEHDHELFWSEELGWSHYDNATFYTEEWREKLDLPIGGFWATDVTNLLSLQ